MSWAWFWFAALILVCGLILLSRMGAARGWAGRVFGRVLPDFSKLGAGLSLLSGRAWVKLLAIPLVLGAIWGVVAYIEGRGALREQIKTERANTQMAEFERDLAGKAISLAEETHTTTRTANAAARQGQQDIDNAVASLPPVVTEDHFAELDCLYVRSYLRVLELPQPGNTCEPDPNPSRSPGVRSAGADAA